jgi:sugar (pentulose or hexulose) kinase
MAFVLGLDMGTSKICALALDAESGEPVAVVSAANGADVANLPAGWREQNPESIFQTVCECLHGLLTDPAVRDAEIAGVGVTGQMHGVLLVNRQLKPLTSLITWQDQRTAGPVLDFAREALGPQAFARHGCQLNTGYGAATLKWLLSQERVPEGACALSLADYLVARLTGIQATEPTHAASWGILDLHWADWDTDALASLGIPPEILPPVVPSAQPVGTLLPDVAKTLGLPEGVVVCAPVGDNQASVVAAAGLNLDAIVLNLGTGGQISVPSRECISAPGLETRPMPFGTWLTVGASLCGGWAYAYLCDFFQSVAQEMTGQAVSRDQAFERLNALAAAAPAGCEGLRADTRFSGTRNEPSLRGSLQNLDSTNFTPANLARGVLEGMVRELADLGRLAGLGAASRVVASGNAVRKNPILKSLIEEAFQMPCSLAQYSEEAALGAALCAGRSLGF